MPTLTPAERSSIFQSRWRTKSEFEFIDSIKSRGQGEPTRLAILLKYRESLKLRVEWGEVDPQKVANYLSAAIQAERGS